MKQASLNTNNKGEKVTKISFPYDLDLIFKIRDIPGRKWHKDAKVWSCPVSIENIKTLRNLDFKISKTLRDEVQKFEQRSDEIIAIGGIPGLQGTLYPYQAEGVAFIEYKKGNALIADEMGLGKTIQALAWCQLHRNLSPVIILTPASVKLNWKKETEKWLPDPNVEILRGTTPWKIEGKIIILNYDILHAWVTELRRIKAKILITDEAQMYKNNKARRTKAVKMLAKTIPNTIILTGTPILNRPVEIFNALNILAPEEFQDYWYYTHHFCNAKNNGFGLDVSGTSNTQELHQRLTSTVMLRRLKKDVLKDLPDKTFAVVPMEIDNEKNYIDAEEDFISFIHDKMTRDISPDLNIHERKEKELQIKEKIERISNAEVLTRIGGLKQLAVKGKLKTTINWIEDFLDTDQKLVVFAHHKFVIEALMTHFKDIAVKLDGSVTSDKKRQEAVDKFQTDPSIKLFVGEFESAGKAITLTASSNVAFIELPWAPGTVDQCADRCHRIGQKDAVTVYYLIASNTIEEKLALIIDEKRKIMNAVLDGTVPESGSLLSTLIDEYV